MKSPRVNGRAAAVLLLSLAGCAPSLCLAQTTVQIDFRNRIPGLLDAPVYDADGITPLAGSNWYAQLWTGNAPDNLAPIGVPIPFLEGAEAGYWAHDTVNVPWARPGDTAWVQVRVLGHLPCGHPFPQVETRAVSRVMEVVMGDSPVPLQELESIALPRPVLSVEHRGDQVVVSWVHPGDPAYQLQRIDGLGVWAGWKTVWTLADPCSTYFGDTLTVTLDNTGAAAFFRLSL